MEALPTIHLGPPRITLLLAQRSFEVSVPISPDTWAALIRVTVSDTAGDIATETSRSDLDLTPTVRITLPPARTRVWSPDDPHLCDLGIELLNPVGEVLDVIGSYAGLRSVSIDRRRVLLNGEPVFQRLVLDQGYYPDTLVTAPDEAALVSPTSSSVLRWLQRSPSAPEGVRTTVPLPC